MGSGGRKIRGYFGFGLCVYVLTCFRVYVGHATGAEAALILAATFDLSAYTFSFDTSILLFRHRSTLSSLIPKLSTGRARPRSLSSLRLMISLCPLAADMTLSSENWTE